MNPHGQGSKRRAITGGVEHLEPARSRLEATGQHERGGAASGESRPPIRTWVKKTTCLKKSRTTKVGSIKPGFCQTQATNHSPKENSAGALQLLVWPGMACYLADTQQCAMIVMFCSRLLSALFLTEPLTVQQMPARKASAPARSTTKRDTTSGTDEWRMDMVGVFGGGV